MGADPGDIINADNTYRDKPNSEEARAKTFLLLNVGTQQFLNVGGSYGRHATLSDTGMYLWIFNNPKTTDTYNIRTRQNYTTGNPNNADSYVQYIDNDKLQNGVYLDCQQTDASRSFGWKFEKADGYDASQNKVYKISTYGNRYLTATPDDANGNLCEATSDSPASNNYQVWKLITVAEYYKLFYESPSDLSSPVDATFLLQNPGFNYSKSDMEGWIPTGAAGIKDKLRLGVEGYYKLKTEKDYKGDDIKSDKYLCENGKYFCADIKNVHQAGIIQQIEVSKPGWYIFRCNGFSNTNGLAKIFITTGLKYYYIDGSFVATNVLNPLDTQNGPKDLLEAGERFFKGEYENQVMMYVSQKDIDTNPLAKGKQSLEFGIMIDGDKNTTPTNEWTAFDNFRMLYAGDAETPNLVLDEDNPDLRYLTETTDEYKNSVLHLRRSFTLNKWNTLILPVSLTYGQMKRTFGDDVKLAVLKHLTTNSIQFWTVDCKNDNDTMLQAFKPYIIMPTKEAGQNPSYTTPRLKKADNQYWIADTNQGISYDGEGVIRYGGGAVTVNENHYDISGITLDRDLLQENVDNHWVSTCETSSDDDRMVCKGTMAKTFYTKDSQDSNGKTITKGYFYTDDNTSRDKLQGAYFMKKGDLWKVPADKTYGLQAFRCWFSLSNTTDQQSQKVAQAKDVKIWLDGVEDNTTTGIDDIIIDDPFNKPSTTYKATDNAVYNLNGQLIRQGCSTEGLPSSIYIVKGRKVIVR